MFITLTLPLETPEKSCAVSGYSHESATPSEPLMSYRFLLVTENADTPWTRQLWDVLQGMGTLEIAAQDTAVCHLTASQFDLLIVDAGQIVDFPVLVRRLRSRHGQTPIIVATASPTWQRAREARRAGASDYLVKSLNPKELQARLHELLTIDFPPGIDE